MIDSLIICRCGSTADAGAQLSAVASLTAELDAHLPEAIFEARDQDYTWAEIAARLDMPESNHPTPLQRLCHPSKGDAQQLRLRLTINKLKLRTTRRRLPARHRNAQPERSYHSQRKYLTPD
jgi:hypothetical protein